jgi:hypothetical protein
MLLSDCPSTTAYPLTSLEEPFVDEDATLLNIINGLRDTDTLNRDSTGTGNRTVQGILIDRGGVGC